MLKSLRLGKLFGIDVYLHATFWLLPALVLLSGLMSRDSWDAIVFNLVLVLAICACVLLHEFGHALAARACGVHVRHITMYPIVGLTSMEGIPSRPSREMTIALAGPAVNLALAGALRTVLLVITSMNSSVDRESPVYVFVYELALANLLLCLLNLIPSFPLDGGQALRAILCLRLNRFRATTVTVGVGMVAAGVCLVFGLLLPQPALVVLAVILFLMGHVELALMRVREIGRGLRDWLEDYFAPREARTREPHPAPTLDGPPSPGFSGLAWDATRRVWIEWKNGVRVGPLPPGR